MSRSLFFFQGILTSLLDLIYPPLCASCFRGIGHRSKHSESEGFCEKCSLELQDQEILSVRLRLSANKCRFCSIELHSFEKENGICLACSSFPPACDRLFSLFTHRGIVEDLIKQFKYHKRLEAGHFLGKMLAKGAKCILESQPDSPAWDMIVPIPSSDQMLVKRGFNHTGLVAKRVGQALNIPVRPLLVRSRTMRAPQAKLPPEERINNLKDAFRIHKVRLVASARVLLIDDVATTGATICEVAEVLKGAGALHVDAITLSRSPRFSENRLRALFSSKEEKRAA